MQMLFLFEEINGMNTDNFRHICRIVSHEGATFVLYSRRRETFRKHIQEIKYDFPYSDAIDIFLLLF